MKATDEEQAVCLNEHVEFSQTTGRVVWQHDEELIELLVDLHTEMPYGKHQGRMLLCIPLSYLDGQFRSMDDGVFKFCVERILRSSVAARMFRSGNLRFSVGEFLYRKCDDDSHRSQSPTPVSTPVPDPVPEFVAYNGNEF